MTRSGIRRVRLAAGHLGPASGPVGPSREALSRAYRMLTGAAPLATRRGTAPGVAILRGDAEPRDHTFLDLVGRAKPLRECRGADERAALCVPSGWLFATRRPEPPDQMRARRMRDGALVARIPVDPADFMTWYDEDRIEALSTRREGHQDNRLPRLRGAPLAWTSRNDGPVLLGVVRPCRRPRKDVVPVIIVRGWAVRPRSWDPPARGTNE